MARSVAARSRGSNACRAGECPEWQRELTVNQPPHGFAGSSPASPTIAGMHITNSGPWRSPPISLRQRLIKGARLSRFYKMMPHDDPAEQDGFLRFFYRNWRPTRLGRVWNGAYAWAAGLGLTPPILLALQTRDQKSGRLDSTVLVPVEYQGQRYIVSMLGGDSQWVKNVRAAGGEAFIKRGKSQRVVLTEIPTAERASIIKAWCEIATSGRRHLVVPHDAPLSAFEAIAENYPVFRIDPAA